MGKLSLPTKVKYRGEIVLSKLGYRLPGLQTVLKAAVQCRNHFVHGSDFDLNVVEPYFSLLTDSLEFVFAASDLIEVGWRADEWGKGTSTGGHRFVSFLENYSASIDGFIAAYQV